MINHTLIEDIIEISDEISEEISIPKDVDKYEYIFDMEKEKNVRAQFMEEMDVNIQHEITNRLMMMYHLSQTLLIKEFLEEVILHSFVDSTLKLEICECMIDYSVDAYELLDSVLMDITVGDYQETHVKPECVLNSILILSKSTKHVDETCGHFTRFINDYMLPIAYRYKIVLSTENLDTLDVIKYQKIFFDNKDNYITYRIMSAQYLLENNKEEEYRNKVQEVLHTFILNDNLTENNRADAADVLLSNGDTKYIQIARDAIMELGRDLGPATIYSNKQNVHTKEIDESSKQIISYILDIPNDYTMEQVSDTIMSLPKLVINEDDTEEVQDEKKALSKKVEFSLTRILLDRTSYLNHTLQDILTRLFSLIVKHKHTDEMTNRLFEELVDMSDTCASGHLTRLASTLNGFVDNMHIKISYQDQIVANLNGRLYAKLRDTEDEDIRDCILNEMIDTSLPGERRATFLKFFRENISDIRETMWKEYCDNEIDGRLIDDTSFDLYFKIAIIHFTTGETF